jgi:hypothetical protein
MPDYNIHDGQASQLLTGADTAVLRAYEDAATAIGRLDASARLAPPGLRELLILRCIATPDAVAHDRMIALVRDDGERDDPLRIYAAAVRDGAARARGGAVPSLASLHELLRTPAPAQFAASLDALLRDSRERTPPVLKAALAALAIREAPADLGDESATARLASLAVTLVLCVGGATTDAWLTLPRPRAAADISLRGTFAALAREARAAERALIATRELCYADEQRVRDSLGRAAYSALDVLALLRERIVITVPETARELGQTPPTTGAAVARLVELGIAREVTGRARSREFAYEGIVSAVQPEPLARQ